MANEKKLFKDFVDQIQRKRTKFESKPEGAAMSLLTKDALNKVAGGFDIEAGDTPFCQFRQYSMFEQHIG
ncbi:MAG: hypothetical protein ING69_12830 [Rhodocyclaceae bacterium]|nr:hypothetical protein [Rhodocyclaceae bacterium]